MRGRGEDILHVLEWWFHALPVHVWNVLNDETDSPEGIESMKSAGLLLKEGCHYKFRLSFRVQVGS